VLAVHRTNRDPAPPRTQIDTATPIVGCGAGTGISAKMDEAGMGLISFDSHCP